MALVYNYLNGLPPSYITELIQPRTTAEGSTEVFIAAAPGRTWSNVSTEGDTASPVLAPKRWNSLTRQIRAQQSFQEFKTLLKYHLFSFGVQSQIGESPQLLSYPVYRACVLRVCCYLY